MVSLAKQQLETGNFRVRVKEEVVCRNLGGEHILLDLETGNFYSLNETGSQIWDLLKEGAEPAEIVFRIVEGFETTPETAKADFQVLLIELVNRGLVQVEEKA